MLHSTSRVSVKELNIELLTDEGIGLLGMEIGKLYAALGAQLLARNLPRRAAGIATFLSSVRSAAEAKTFCEALPYERSFMEWSKGMGVIYEELKQDGMRHMEEISADLRKALCNEDILRLSDSETRSAMQIVILVVGATLRLPREFDSISVTVSAILFNLGLRNFCRERGGSLNGAPQRLSD
jgi:hypothetical protein